MTLPLPSLPSSLAGIAADTERLGFTMASDALTGALLRTLARTKLDGAFLELGTGTGLATAWLLDGMSAGSTLLSVDHDGDVAAIARRHLAHDARISFVVADGEAFLLELCASGRKFDFIFADTWPGKYTHLDEALSLLHTGGLYVIDDMLPQTNWPEDHPPKVQRLIATLYQRSDLELVSLEWSTGVIVVSKK